MLRAMAAASRTGSSRHGRRELRRCRALPRRQGGTVAERRAERAGWPLPATARDSMLRAGDRGRRRVRPVVRRQDIGQREPEQPERVAGLPRTRQREDQGVRPAVGGQEPGGGYLVGGAAGIGLIQAVTLAEPRSLRTSAALLCGPAARDARISSRSGWPGSTRPDVGRGVMRCHSVLTGSGDRSGRSRIVLAAVLASSAISWPPLPMRRDRPTWRRRHPVPG